MTSPSVAAPAPPRRAPILRRPGVRAAIAVVLALVTLSKFIGRGGHFWYFLDTDVYMIGGRRLLDGEPLYVGAFETSAGVPLPFTYPPFAAVLFAPLSLLPLVAASVLMTVATAACLWWVVAVVVGRHGGLDRVDAGWLAAAITAVLLWYGPVHSTIAYGQINVLLMAMVVTDALVVPPKYRGLLTGAAVAVKLTPAVFGLWFLLRRDWPAIARMGIAAGGLTFLAHVIVPSDSVRYWTSTLFDTGRIGAPMEPSNQSIEGELWRLHVRGEDSGTLVWLLLVLLALAATALVMAKLLRNGQPFLALGANAIFGLLASPVSWAHHWVWGPVLCIAVAALAFRSPERVPLAGFFAVAGLLVLFRVPQEIAPDPARPGVEWAWYWHIFGNLYILWGVAALVMSWFLASRLPRVNAGLNSPT